MIGVIIGSGIFNTPTVAAANIGRPGLILILWMVGGVLALFGALTYAELCTRYPRSGGMYVFLREGFGPIGRPLAFTFGWTYMIITKPFAAAGIMVPGAEHILKLVGYPDPVPEVPKLALTTALLLFFTGINIPGVKIGTGLAGVLTTVKFGALALIVLVALALRKGSDAGFQSAPVNVPLITALGVTLSAILWTYDGWADVGSIAGEVRNPRRTLPFMFIAGVAAVTALYLAVNAVFMWMLPMTEMAATNTVAPVVAGRLMGHTGATVVTALVVVSTLGSSHASIITGARVTFAQARDGLLFRSLGKIHAKHQTPAVALWVQCILSIAAVWTLKTFESLASGFVFTMWIFYGLAGVALILMRWREKRAPIAHTPHPTCLECGYDLAGLPQGRPCPECGALPDPPESIDPPFRCPAYPIVPILFILSALSMTVLSVMGNPWETLPWLAVLSLGFPMYYAWLWITGREAST
jgi:amino acid transporter